MNQNEQRHLRIVHNAADAPPLDLDDEPQTDPRPEEETMPHDGGELVVRDQPGQVAPLEPSRVWSPRRTVEVMVGPLARQVDVIRHEKGGVLRVGARATKSGVSYGSVGIFRAAGAWYRWVTAAEYAETRATQGAFVEETRSRRRRISLISLGVGAVGDGALWWFADWPWWGGPSILLGVTAAIGGTTEFVMRRAKAESEADDQGRKTLGARPGSKAVRRAVANAKLGRFEDIRILAPGVHREQPTATAPGAWSCLVELAPGTPAKTAEKKCLELAAAIGVGLSQVAVDPVRGNASRFELWVADSDPLAGETIPSPLVSRTAPFDVWRDKVAVGVDVRGRPVGFRLPERSILTGGEPGAGKSVACNNVLCSVALDPRSPMWLIDGKGGSDLLDYEPIAERFLGDPDPEAMLEMCTDLQDLMSDRYRRLKAVGARKVTPEIADELGMYPLLFHIDELQAFTADPDLGRKITYVLWDIVSRGRAALVIESGATQRPAPEVVPSKLGAILSIRWAMRCTDDKSSDTILGKGWAGRGFNAGLLDPTQRGAGFLLAESAVPTSMRTYFLSDNDVEVLTRRAYRLREQAGTLPANESNPGVLLLTACLGACGGTDKIWTSELLERLTRAPEWSHLADDPAALAALLRPLGVTPAQVWISDGNGSGANRQGYTRPQFEEALNGLSRR